MNFLRGDVARLGRSCDVVTGAGGPLPRCKPLMFAFEKEIVLYAHMNKLDYFSTECLYSPNAFRGHVRTLIKELEALNPQHLIDTVHSGFSYTVDLGAKARTILKCEKCGYMSSNKLCKACVQLEGLNRGQPSFGVSNAARQKKIIAIQYDES
eukprot:Selendium_serpulae@DN4733_c0_g1_i2.p1